MKFNINFKIILFILIFLIVSSILAGSQSQISIPLNNKIYNIIKNAEIRGIIDNKIAVRPYSASNILSDLKTIKDSRLITESERIEIINIINDLESQQIDNSFHSMLQHGTYFSYFEELDITTKMGIKLDFQYTQSFNNQAHYDSRNGGEIYIQSDYKNLLSFFMNIGIRFDHVDYHPFLKNDFTIPTKGKYDTFWDHDTQHTFYYGINAAPEVSISLLKGNMSIRWASIKRDWGVGLNNLMLSESASSFNAVELSLNVTPWLRYAFIAGALGKLSLGDTDDFYKEYFISSKYLHDRSYENNFSAHRVEVSLPWNLRFGIFESVVYRKRFELGYLNPLSILMFEQNIIGDLDNMLAGVDFQWILPNFFRLYATAATTEMNEINPTRFFVAPRNILSMQAGIDITVPLIPFSVLTFQYTYLPPFFYSHYPNEGLSGESVYQELSMVNEGRNIGYPLRPNSDEFLFNYNFILKNNWDGSLQVKYQRRSGQYGWNIDQYMVYSAAKNNKYDDKNFRDYIFEKTIGIDATINKSFNNFPIKLSLSYLLNFTTTRSTGKPSPAKVWDGNDVVDWDSLIGEPDRDDYYKYPIIKYDVTGNWNPWVASNAIKVAVNIWL